MYYPIFIKIELIFYVLFDMIAPYENGVELTKSNPHPIHAIYTGGKLSK